MPGILNWAIKGCLEWQRIGLCDPPEVVAAIKEYRSEMDVFSQFIDERCVKNDDAKVTAALIYGEYKMWAAHEGIGIPMTKTAFGKKMTAEGYQKKRDENGNIYLGIRLASHVF